MKNLFTFLAALIFLAAPASAQTIKSLGYNTTNGVVVYNSTNQLVFTNAVRLSTGQTASLSVGSSVDLAKALWDTPNDAPALEISDGEVALAGGTVPENFRIALGMPWSGLTNTNATTMRSALGLGTTDSVEFKRIDVEGTLSITNSQITGQAIGINFSTGSFSGDSLASVRSSLGLGLLALTNTNNVRMMRALAGSTNTNEPYSGTVALTNTNVLTFSNGVLLKIQ